MNRLERFTMNATDRKAARQWGTAASATEFRTVTARPRFTLPRLTEKAVLNVLTACAVVFTLAAFVGQADTRAEAAAPDTVARIIAIDYLGNEFVAGEGDDCKAAEVGMVLPVGVVEYGCHIEPRQ